MKTAKAKKESTNLSDGFVRSSLTKDQIAFQRGMIIPSEKSASKAKRLTIQAELMKLGYMLDKDALEEVSVEWYEDIRGFIKTILGIGSYSPFYKNFPQQVMEMDECELFMNAILHYYSDGKWEPVYALEKRGIKFEKTEFKKIKLGTEKEFTDIFTNLVSINQSITENDKDIIKWFCENYDANKLLKKVERIPFKENLCILASHGLDVPVKTPNDVLRIIVYLSGGDISMPAVPKIPIDKKGYKVINSRLNFFFNNRKEAAINEREKFKFKNFSRSKRRYLMSLLEKTNLDLGEMKLRIGRWLRVGDKCLHPGDFKNQFPKTFSAFHQLRNHADKIHTWQAEVEVTFSKNPKNGIEMLAQRPGEFARRLDWMLRNFSANDVMEKFNQVSSVISRKVLWELYNHFLKRDVAAQRSIMIKGKKSKRKILEPLKPMSKTLITKVQYEILKALTSHFSQMDKLGNVWIDDRLKKVPLPFAMRSMNTAIRTYIRGTRVPFSDTAKVIRPYIHWLDERGTEDLDLSVGFYDEKLNSVSHISYTNLKDSKLNSCHSGDIRHREGRCAEYVDIDIKKCLENNARYAIVQVHNFDSRPMHTIKECVFGLMEREFPEAGKIFVPKTIQNCVSVANESFTVCVCILDLKNREYIWADLELESGFLSNFESTSKMSHQILVDLIQSNKTSLSVYDLFSMHGESRGKIVTDVKKAKTIFTYEDFVTGYEKIAMFM